MDKHGKKKSGSKKKAASDLKAFYNIEENESSGTKSPSEGEDKAESRLDYLSKLSRGEISGSGSDSDSDESDGSNQASDSDTSDDSDSDDAFSARKGGALSIPGDKISTTKRSKNRHGAAVEVGQIPMEEEESDDDVDVETSNRLAIQNCDWDNMSAEDIMAILQSFCSTMSLQSGSIKSVTVYPSDYGLERIEAENLHGPPKAIWNNSASKTDDESDSGGDSDSNSDDDSSTESDGSNSSEDNGNIHILHKNHPEELLKSGISVNDKIRKKKEFDREASNTGLVFNLDNADSDNEDLPSGAGGRSASETTSKSGDDNINVLALREYELSKLRYYFAIAELDNASVAEKLYGELDGIEFEHSSMALDLRFVPNDVSFEGRLVRDRYVGTMSAAYAPPEGFVVNALQVSDINTLLQ